MEETVNKLLTARCPGRQCVAGSPGGQCVCQLVSSRHAIGYKLGIVLFLEQKRRNSVIANQCSHWCGNPQNIPRTIDRAQRLPLLTKGSCHEVTEGIRTPALPGSLNKRSFTIPQFRTCVDARTTFPRERQGLRIATPV